MKSAVFTPVAMLVLWLCALPSAVANDAQWLSEYVIRAQLTNNIQSREPVDQLSPQLTTRNSAGRRIFFFTEIQGMRGQQVRHQWLHEQRVVADLSLPIGGERWRTWSSKQLPPGWLGEWRVRVLDRDGEILAEQRFSYR